MDPLHTVLCLHPPTPISTHTQVRLHYPTGLHQAIHPQASKIGQNIDRAWISCHCGCNKHAPILPGIFSKGKHQISRELMELSAVHAAKLCFMGILVHYGELKSRPDRNTDITSLVY